MRARDGKSRAASSLPGARYINSTRFPSRYLKTSIDNRDTLASPRATKRKRTEEEVKEKKALEKRVSTRYILSSPLSLLGSVRPSLLARHDKVHVYVGRRAARIGNGTNANPFPKVTYALYARIVPLVKLREGLPYRVSREKRRKFARIRITIIRSIDVLLCALER